VYGKGLQTETAMGLWLGFAPDNDEETVLNNLIANIQNHTNHPTTGILGWKYMLETLTEHGRSDVALLMNLQDTYPSFGYMIQGVGNPEPATTIWELWDSPVEGPGMNSRNHIMFGTVGSWFYKALIGLAVENGPNVVSLGPDGSLVNMYNLTSVSAKTRLAYGQIEVSWTVQLPSICVTSPENTVATVACEDNAVIIQILDAYYGTPKGDCSGFQPGSCNSANAFTNISELCLGTQSCSIPVNNVFFGGDPCFGKPKTFALRVNCSKIIPYTFDLNVVVPIGQQANINVPVMQKLGQNIQNLKIEESGEVVWKGGLFVPGVTGIYKASANAAGNGITFMVGSGSYSFQSFAIEPFNA